MWFPKNVLRDGQEQANFSRIWTRYEAAGLRSEVAQVEHWMGYVNGWD